MDVLDRVLKGDNLSVSEYAKLYEYDIFTLGKAADSIRKEKYGNKVFFNMNRHINPSNICADVCKFCAFSAGRKNPNMYEMSIDEIVSQAISSYNRGAKEVHVVSAHNPNYTYNWFLELFGEIKKALPQIHLKAMTAAEVDFMERKSGVAYQKILEDIAKAGVDSMPGGGAEIFDEKVRKHICNGKVSSAKWIDIHRYWHSLGKMSNCTMLFGHVENRENRIDHMLRIKNAQQDTNIVDARKGGFNAFIPLLYQAQNNYLKVDEFPSGQEILKTISISRLVLDNVPHIKAYWATLSMNLALVAQEFGADDMDGTIEAEAIQSAGGAKSKAGMGKDDMVAQIKNAGFKAVERDSLYYELQEW